MTENNETEMLRVILCKPGETAEVVEIDDDLESMQELVGGLIQEYMPFHSETDPRYDDVAIICNEEGKLIASKHPQWKMEKRFEESLDQFRPYIFLTRKEYAAILESQQNDDKFHKSKEGVSKMLKPKFKFTLVPQFPANLL